jgi:L-amino acid N-acyltransferase YncA
MALQSTNPPDGTAPPEVTPEPLEDAVAPRAGRARWTAAPAASPSEALEHRLRARGPAGVAAWTVIAAARPLGVLFSPPCSYVFLERSLEAPLPRLAPPAGVRIEPYAAMPPDALDRLWPRHLVGTMRRAMTTWLAAGAWAFVAIEDGTVAGLIVLAAKSPGDDIRLRPEREATWIVSLRLAPDAHGRGIGPALLSRSLVDGRERGYRSSVCFVWRDNPAMLAAATRKLGYRVIGTGTKVTVLGLARWWSEIEGRRRRGPVVVI